MANQYDTNLKLQAIADAIGNSGSSGLIQALEDIADAVAGGGGGSSAGLVSDNFSETDTYDLGDYCIHNNTLYVCINAITTPGPWDLSDWQATNAGIQLSSLNSAISTINSSITNRATMAKNLYDNQQATMLGMVGESSDGWAYVSMPLNVDPASVNITQLLIPGVSVIPVSDILEARFTNGILEIHVATFVNYKKMALWATLTLHYN